jgi:hypothetical protein
LFLLATVGCSLKTNGGLILIHRRKLEKKLTGDYPLPSNPYQNHYQNINNINNAKFIIYDFGA